MYPYINNNIEYGLFEDVINSYYLDSQIKDDFSCDQECYASTPQTQQNKQLTTCTHAYDHITQHINNLDNSAQQNTLYTMEEDVSLVTSDTATPCEYNITKLAQNPNIILDGEPKFKTQLEFIHKVNRNIEMSLVTLTYSIMTLIMVMHSLSKTSTQHYYNRNYKTLIGVYMILLGLRVVRHPQKWT